VRDTCAEHSTKEFKLWKYLSFLPQRLSCLAWVRAPRSRPRPRLPRLTRLPR